LRSRDRRSGRIPVGKFNAGQKLNASFSLGAIIVMFGTGMVMFFSSLFTDTIRTGATFVHDWLALALAVVVLGHIYMAYNDPVARRGMRTGIVPEDWAQREHGAWAAEMAQESALAPSPASAPPS
jgi:formate dehydrogenase subunit gamma